MDFNTDWLLTELRRESYLSSSGIASLAAFKRFVGDFISLADIYDTLGRLAQEEIRTQLEGHLSYTLSCDQSAGTISRSNIEFVADLLDKVNELIDRKLFHYLADEKLVLVWFSEIIELDAIVRGKLQQSSPNLNVERAEFASLAALLKLLELCGAKIRARRNNSHKSLEKPHAQLTELLALLSWRFSPKTPKSLVLQALCFINDLVPILKHHAIRQAIGSELTGFMINEFRSLCLGRIFESLISLKWEQDAELRSQVFKLARGLCNDSFQEKLRSNLRDYKHNHDRLALGFAMLHAIIEDGHSNAASDLFGLVTDFMQDPEQVHYSYALKLLHSLIRFKRLTDSEVEDLKARMVPLDDSVASILAPKPTCIMDSGTQQDIKLMLCKAYPGQFSSNVLTPVAAGNYEMTSMDERFVTSALVANELGFATRCLQELLSDSRWFWSTYIVGNIKRCERDQTNAILIRKLLELIDKALDVGNDGIFFECGHIATVVETIMAYCENCPPGAIDSTMYNLLKLVKSNYGDKPEANIWPLYHAVFCRLNAKTIIRTFEPIALAIESNRKAFLKSPLVLERIVKLIELTVTEVSLPKYDYERASARFKLIEVMITNYHEMSLKVLLPILADLTSPILADGEDTREALDYESACFGANFAALYIDQDLYCSVYKDHSTEGSTSRGSSSRMEKICETAKNLLGFKSNRNLFDDFMKFWSQERLEREFNIYHQRLRLLALSRIIFWSPENRPPVVVEVAHKFLPIMLKWLERMKEEYEVHRVQFSWNLIYEVGLNGPPIEAGGSDNQQQTTTTDDAELEKLRRREILEFSPSLFKNLDNEIEALQKALAHCRADAKWFDKLTESLNEDEKRRVITISEFGTKVSRQLKPKKNKLRWRPTGLGSKFGRRR